MTQESSPIGYGGMLLAFLAGAAVGAAALALTTRKTGPERCADLKDLAGQARRKAKGIAEGADQAWEEAKDRTSRAAGDLKRGFTDAAQDLRG